MAGSSQPPMSLATGNIVVPPFISFYCTLGNPIPSSQAAPSFGSRSASRFSLPASSFLTPRATPLSSGSLNVSCGTLGLSSSWQGFCCWPGLVRTGQFVELADLLAENLKAQEVEPQTFLDGKHVVSSTKKRVTEITDVIAWVQAVTV